MTLCKKGKKQYLVYSGHEATFIISSEESAERKAADVEDRDEGIASAISEERSLTDALCSRPIPDEIMKVAGHDHPRQENRMTTRPAHLYSVGQVYHQFKVTKSTEIPELYCHLYELIHLPTEARIMYIANDDPENLFNLSFQTLPSTSNGVAHILEHTVLCGSKKFPVKDPFFAMTRRSLNTFMNALTGSDFTCYPAASQVPKDFYNLLEVYLDAVFHPKLERMSFLQEGHRLEFSNPSDPKSPLERKGVVYNEMKGAMASPLARLDDVVNATLFPDLTYGINSGGDPKVIPQLTYEDLRAFHQKFYHPSRCLFFFYGNMPLEPHLDFIAKHALEGVQKADPLPPIPLQTRFVKPQYVTGTYLIAPEEDTENKAYISFSWLTCRITDQEDLLALGILEIILMDTDASILKKALLKSGMCKLVSSSINDDISEIPLTITLQGCNPDKADDCEKLIRSTLHSVADQGIPLEKVENAIHQLEFYGSEITGGQYPFGLSLFMRSALLKQHNVHPEEGLKIHSLFDGVHKRVVENPNYLGNLIRKYLLDNPHFVRVILIPDKTLMGKEHAAERLELDKIQKDLTAEQTQALISQAEKLSTFQKKQEEEDFSILPKVTLDDVSKCSRSLPLIKEKTGNLDVFYHNAFTNKIIYADLVYNLPKLHEEDMATLRLFTYLLSQMGSNGRNYAENLEYMQAHTGGIGASLAFNLQATDHTQFHPSLFIRGRALNRKASKLFTLMQDTVTSVDFTDIHRIREVIEKHYTGLESSLISGAMRYAINLSASSIDRASKIANEWYGIDYFLKIREIAQNLNHEIPKLINKMKEFQDKLLCLENPHLVLTCDAGMYDELKGHHFYGLGQIETKPYTPWSAADYPLVPVRSQGRTIASPMAFIGKVFNTVSYVHPDSPALGIASTLFDDLTLHPRIREQGGAYGGGSSSNSMSGNFYFYSYRDPNISRTLNAFEEAIQKIEKGNFDEVDLEESKLELIQNFDSPIAPGNRGSTAYGWMREGKTPEARQAFRNRLLSLTCSDVVKAVKEHIVPNYETGATVVFSGKELLEKENKIFAEQGKTPLPIESI